MYSSNDPIFYMHHANVDRIWHMWQSMHPSKALDYSGHSPVTRRNSRLSDTIDIGYGSKYAKTRTVRELMQVSALGYTYSTGVTPVRGPPPTPPQSQSGNRFTRWRNNAWSTVRRLFSTRQTPRKHKVMIKYLEPLPATWVQANNLDAAKLERRRRKVNRFTKWLNSLKNFFPRVIDSTVSFFRSRTRREYESREKALVETVKIYKAERIEKRASEQTASGRGSSNTQRYSPRRRTRTRRTTSRRSQSRSRRYNRNEVRG